MCRIAMSFALIVLWCPCLRAEDPTAADKYQKLLEQYEQEGGSRIFARQFLRLAAEYPQDKAAMDAALWVVENVRGRSDTTRALEILRQDHVRREGLGAACGAIAASRSPAAEDLLRAIAARHPDPQIGATALLYLTRLLETEAAIVKQLASQPELADRVVQYYGDEYGKHLASLKPGDLEAKLERAFEQMQKDFADQVVEEDRLGELAEAKLFGIRHLSVGKVAPDIEGEDIHGRTFKLSDYRGKVVMITFWGHW